MNNFVKATNMSGKKILIPIYNIKFIKADACGTFINCFDESFHVRENIETIYMNMGGIPDNSGDTCYINLEGEFDGKRIPVTIPIHMISYMTEAYLTEEYDGTFVCLTNGWGITVNNQIGTIEQRIDEIEN